MCSPVPTAVYILHHGRCAVFYPLPILFTPELSSIKHNACTLAYMNEIKGEHDMKEVSEQVPLSPGIGIVRYRHRSVCSPQTYLVTQTSRDEQYANHDCLMTSPEGSQTHVPADPFRVSCSKPRPFDVELGECAL